MTRRKEERPVELLTQVMQCTCGERVGLVSFNPPRCEACTAEEKGKRPRAPRKRGKSKGRKP